MSEQEDDGLGPISALANVPQVTKDILDMLSYLFIDYQPNDEDNQRAVFVYAATISDEDADDEEADDEEDAEAEETIEDAGMSVVEGEDAEIADIDVAVSRRERTRLGRRLPGAVPDQMAGDYSNRAGAQWHFLS